MNDDIRDLLRARDPAQQESAAARYREAVDALAAQGRSRDYVMRHSALAAGLRLLMEAFEATALDDSRENAASIEGVDVAALRRYQQRRELRRPWFEAVHELSLLASEQVAEARPVIERCLLSRDSWLHGKTAEILRAAPSHAWASIDSMREHVRRFGVDCDLAAAAAASARGLPERALFLMDIARDADEDEAEWACCALGQLGEARAEIAACMASVLARPSLGSALGTGAIRCATSNGVRTPALDARILDAIGDVDEWNMRKAAMQAAEALSMPLGTWIDHVAEAVVDEGSYEPSVGEVAAGILARLGPRARAALPKLTSLLFALGEDRASSKAAERVRHVIAILDDAAAT